MQEILIQNWLKFIRLYTFYSPIRKGKYRLFTFALKMCSSLPKKIDSATHDGRKFESNLTTGMHDQVFFLGEYERAVTNVIETLIREDDVCLDVGANFGWFATLMSQKCGRKGQVYAFEPVPHIFAELSKNHQLNGSPANLNLVNSALGDEIGEIELFVFPDQPLGHSSVSKQGNSNFIAYKSSITALNQYLKDNNVGEVNLIKVDIEGAELMFLKGATDLFKQKTPPILVMEMALGTSKSFGYTPNDLVEFIRSQCDYDFFEIIDTTFRLKKIDGFRENSIGANVLCIPSRFYSERREKLEFD
jgi:FkbM family methyltransferase